MSPLASWKAAFLLVVLPLAGAAPAAGDDARKQLDSDIFDTSKLLDVSIQMDPKDWDALAAQRRNFIDSFSKTPPKSPYTYFHADITINGVTVKNVGVRKKGFFGSMDSRRPSLKVKFDEFQKNGKLGGLDRLTLNNNKQDAAHVSQILSYEIYRKAGLPAPRANLAKLTVNGKSMGVYGNVESIKKPYLKRQFGNDKGDLFEGVLPADFYADRIERFEIKTNKKSADHDDLRKIAAALAKPDRDLERHLAKFFDMDEFMRGWAMEALIGFWDSYSGNQNNFYLYKNPKDDKFHFIPWGADFAFTNQFSRGPKSVRAKGLMAFELYQIETIRNRYRTQLLELMNTVWNEDEMLAEVDRIGELVKEHLHEDQAGYDARVESFKAFIKSRREEVLAEIEDGPVTVANRPSKGMYYKEVGELAGRFETQWRVDDSTEMVGGAAMTAIIDGKAVEFATQTSVAEPSRFRGFGGRGGRGAPSGPPPPTIALQMQPKGEDAKPLRLVLTVRPDRFAPSDKSIELQGFLSEGRGFGPGMRTFVGKLTLSAAEQKAGSKVSGAIKGKLYQMRGGFGGRRR